MSQMQYAGKGILKNIYNRIKEEQDTVHVIRNLQLNLFELQENTDEYKDFYPYCLDIEITAMKESSLAEVNYSPSVLKKGYMSMQARTMNGFIRLYAEKIPQEDENVIIDNLIWKEMK